MPTSTPTPSAKSGIAVSDSGERHIPSSKRADGSTRREIRVRPGYKPPEDVEVYKNRTAEAWKGKKDGRIPGAEPVNSTAVITGSSTANKNAKRREARKKAAAAATGAADSATAEENIKLHESSIGSSDARHLAVTEGTEEGKAQDVKIKATGISADDNANSIHVCDEEKSLEKDARKLSKKLRQAKELKDRKESGDVLLPEQLEKVIRISEITRQLDGLGFDANGEKKNVT